MEIGLDGGLPFDVDPVDDCDCAILGNSSGGSGPRSTASIGGAICREVIGGDEGGDPASGERGECTWAGGGGWDVGRIGLSRGSGMADGATGV